MLESAELREQLLKLYEAMSRGHAEAVEAHYSLRDGGIFVGTDASEFWTDSAQHNGDVRRFFDGSQGRLTWTAGVALARVEGSVGWTFDQPTIALADSSFVQIRVSLVWHREGDKWLVVHSHASVGVS